MMTHSPDDPLDRGQHGGTHLVLIIIADVEQECGTVRDDVRLRARVGRSHGDHGEVPGLRLARQRSAA